MPIFFQQKQALQASVQHTDPNLARTMCCSVVLRVATSIYSKKVGDQHPVHRTLDVIQALRHKSMLRRRVMQYGVAWPGIFITPLVCKAHGVRTGNICRCRDRNSFLHQERISVACWASDPTCPGYWAFGASGCFTACLSIGCSHYGPAAKNPAPNTAGATTLRGVACKTVCHIMEAVLSAAGQRAWNSQAQLQGARCASQILRGIGCWTTQAWQ